MLVDGVAVPGARLLSGAGGTVGGAIAVAGRDGGPAKAAVLVVATPDLPRAQV